MNAKTYLPKTSEIRRLWYEIDASGHTLGRLATRIANLLRGKHKASFTPHLDVGDFVVVTNIGQVKLTGRKLLQKEYIRFSGYPGGIRRELLRDALVRHPERVIYEAVRNMLAPNRMRQKILRRLKFVKSEKHAYKIDKQIIS